MEKKYLVIPSLFVLLLSVFAISFYIPQETNNIDNLIT